MNERGLWIGVLVGAPLVVLGVLDALGDAGRTRPAELARWVVGTVVVVDLVVMPVALGIGRVLRGRAPLQWALAASATVVVVGWPFLRGYGRNPNNPSLLPRDYGTGVAVAVVAVWLTAGAWTVAAARRRRRPSHVQTNS